MKEKMLKVLFQFHTGSIKRGQRRNLCDSVPKFQFHTGSIKSSPNRLFENTSPMFQFHTGSIKRLPKREKSEFLNAVSIPYWFD